MNEVIHDVCPRCGCYRTERSGKMFCPICDTWDRANEQFIKYVVKKEDKQ